MKARAVVAWLVNMLRDANCIRFHMHSTLYLAAIALLKQKYTHVPQRNPHMSSPHSLIRKKTARGKRVCQFTTIYK